MVSDKKIDTIIFYSDSCTGQNKKLYISTMFYLIIQEYPHIKTIHYKFLTPGHTHMECDVEHSLIEKMKKKLQQNFITLETGTNLSDQLVRNIFHVYEMETKDILILVQLLKTYVSLFGENLVKRMKSFPGFTSDGLNILQITLELSNTKHH